MTDRTLPVTTRPDVPPAEQRVDNGESIIPAAATAAAQPETAPLEAADRDDRTMGVLCHVAALAFFMMPFAGHVLGPLAVWLVGRRRSPFVDANGREALNFNLTVSLAWLVCLPLAWVYYIGAILMVPVGMTWLAFVLIASLKTGENVVYRYPVRIAFLRERRSAGKTETGGEGL
ncbi:MAG: DUF4870 domain-containing protein [Planctomycetes bacterium]|nr:DUF4870 domain-containing protein [Planctomycetota bacterium]